MHPLTSVSFITCVLDSAKYARCRASIEAIEPEGVRVSADLVDNAKNQRSAPEALNFGWERASGDILVFCHEDVIFPADWLRRLLEAVREVERLTAAGAAGSWAVLGPIGRSQKRYFGRASGPDGVEVFHGPLPSTVETLDELCLIVPRDLPLRFDERLGGYHLYGADLCIQAAEAGLGCFAIDASLRHETRTLRRPPEYHAVKRRLQRKWMFRRKRVGSSVGTTCGKIRFGLFEGWI